MPPPTADVGDEITWPTSTGLEIIVPETGDLTIVSSKDIFAFSKEDLGSAAKLVNDFKKDNKLLKPVVVAVNGELVDVAKIGQIAALPNKDQAISMMMAVMKLPIEKFVRTLSAPNVKLVQTLSAYKSKLEQN